MAVQTENPLIVPEEASQIVDGESNRILGRITSSRMSPVLERSICLAQITPELASPGTEITILLGNGQRVIAKVIEGHAHFDPTGSKQNV